MLGYHLACFSDHSLFKNCFAVFRSSCVSMSFTGDMRKSSLRQAWLLRMESGTNIKSAKMLAIVPDIRA